MAILKCKMCGGDLEIAAGTTVGQCEFCGTKQTLPKANEEVLQNLFNRANALRLKCEFDKAEQIYEKILQQDDTEAEAHWGIVLCKYGIEYVEDPKTFHRIPTCHRTSYDAVTADADYLAAIANADASQKAIYEAEAKAIDTLQKDILNIVKNEQPFDVFLCYKETDENGKRTVDSVVANDIYHQLTQEGLKVFYAAITLENKLGQAYEPYIFAALNSAKVMLVIGTKPQYFTAVWVKNEWSRFLRLMKTDRSKLLIPCYKDMDAYDLPEEFAHLQAQDMGKIGFINDVVRGIKKVSIKDEPKETVVKETIVKETTVSGGSNVVALLKRGMLALEDSEWSKADGFFEEALNQDAECAEAYLGKLMAELEVKKQADLQSYTKPFDNRSNYQKAIRFADDQLRQELEASSQAIIDRIEAERKAKVEHLEAIRQKLKATAGLICVGAHHTVALQVDGTVVAAGLNDWGQCNVSDWFPISAVDAGPKFTVGLRCDGSVVAVGWDSDGQCDVSGWTDIVAISAGEDHTVGLKKDGTVVAVGENDKGQCNVSGWTDIVAISAGDEHTVGLKKDGTVVAVGYTGYGRCDVSGWTDIVAISAGKNHTVGLKKDGTVVAVGYTGYGQCDVSNWKNIISIYANEEVTVGLKDDGTVVAVGENDKRQCNVSGWTDIVAISASGYHAVGLKKDGTVVAVGENDKGQCNVGKWTDIIAISVGPKHTVGLTANGTVVAVGDNDNLQCDVDNWKLFDNFENIAQERVVAQAKLQEKLEKIRLEKEAKEIADRKIWEEKGEQMRANALLLQDRFARTSNSDYPMHILANVRGQVFASCEDKWGRHKAAEWTDILALSIGNFYALGLHDNGLVSACGDNRYGQCDVQNWHSIRKIVAGGWHSIGLRNDGTAIACGSNDYHQCEVSGWRDLVDIAVGNIHTVGLKKDGTVVACGHEADQRCNVTAWKNIKKIYAHNGYTVGIRNDGTVVCTNNNFDVSEWENIIDIATGTVHILGLTADGRVLATGNYTNGKLEVDSWRNIVAISALNGHSVGLKADGTVVAAGSNDSGQCNVNDLQDIVAISASAFTTIAVKANGALAYVGSTARYPTPCKWKLFDDISQLQMYRDRDAALPEKIKKVASYRENGRCQHCGGELKGLFSKKCASCGKPKDY